MPLTILALPSRLGRKNLPRSKGFCRTGLALLPACLFPFVPWTGSSVGVTYMVGCAPGLYGGKEQKASREQSSPLPQLPAPIRGWRGGRSPWAHAWGKGWGSLIWAGGHLGALHPSAGGLHPSAGCPDRVGGGWSSPRGSHR